MQKARKPLPYAKGVTLPINLFNHALTIKQKGRFLGSIWLGVLLITTFTLLYRQFNVRALTTDVLGFEAGAGPSAREVAAQNRILYAREVAGPGSNRPLLPDLVAHVPTDLALIGSREAGTLRLKFTTRFSNMGEGPLEVRAESSEASQSERLVQVLYHRSSDDPLSLQPVVGRYTFDQAHGHLHLERFARYELWSVDSMGDLLAPLVSNPKVGFCLLDAELRHPDMAATEEAVYWGCRSEVQGVSVGWGDLYAAQLAAQDLNVSELPDGHYALINIINYGETLLEGDYTNNRAETHLQLVDGVVIVD